MKLFCKEGDSRKNMMMLFLMAVLIMEFLFITLERQFSYIGYYLTEEYIIVPALLFLGYALGGQMTKLAKQRLLLAGAAVSWFAVVQIIHKLSGMDNHPIGTVFFVYLMAFPFASVSEDQENVGIRWVGAMFLAASLVMVGYSALLFLEMVPAAWAEYIYWDGARMIVFWHPNISACFFMLGIGFAAMFLVQTKKLLVKLLLAVSIIVQMVVMIMTHCRTTILLTGALLGAVVLLMVLQRFQPRTVRKVGNKKVKIILCVVLVLLVLAVFFLVVVKLYQWNDARLIAEQKVDTLESVNYQGSLANDMRSLNGRTFIWESAFRAMRDNKLLALFGTEYTGTVISVYNFFEVVHSHNSWMESLMRMGLPGLLLSLVFTALSVWSAAKLVLNGSVELWKKIVAVMTMCLMAAGFLEPYLFITNVYYHVTDFVFFLMTGYLDYWASGIKKLSE